MVVVYTVNIMKIVYNSIIPFKGFLAINLFGILFVRKELKSKLSAIDIQHEQIHTAQMKELLYVFFYIIYLIEWIILLFKYGSNHRAYRNISFEKEAYNNQNTPNYLSTRKHYAQWER